MPDPTPNTPGQDPSGQPGVPTATLESLQKQVEDLATLSKKQAAENDTLRDDLQRTTSMLQAMSRGPEPRGGGSGRPNELEPHAWDDVEKMGVAAEAAERIAQVSAQRVRQEIQKEREIEASFESLRKQFYVENPDLKDHEPVVKHYAQEVQALFPNMTTKQAFAEVGKRCREYIQSKLTPSGNPPPPVLPGGKGGRQPGQGPSGDEPTPSDDIADEIRQRQELRARGIPSMRT